jgi:hypothetical protein
MFSGMLQGTLEPSQGLHNDLNSFFAKTFIQGRLLTPDANLIQPTQARLSLFCVKNNIVFGVCFQYSCTYYFRC